MSDKQLKVALCGKLRSGKDSVGRLFVASGFHRFAFGDKIKEVITVLFPGETLHSKRRRVMQGVGQSLRHYDADIWVNTVLREIEAQGCSRADIIITDLRQPNEYRQMKADGYIFVRVAASEEIRIQRAIDKGDDFNIDDMHHETESHVEGFMVDYTISNDGTPEELERQTMELLHELRRGASSEGITT